MPRPLWKHDPAAGTYTIDLPSSVEKCGSLDDPQMLREIDQAYGTARREGRRLVLSLRALIAIVDSTINLAGDHLAEGDLSSGPALRWARNRADALVAAGVAKRHWTGGIEAI